MDSLWSGHEFRETDLSELRYSVDVLTPDNKKRHWTGLWWRLDSRSGLWNAQQHQQTQQQSQQPQQPTPQQTPQPNTQTLQPTGQQTTSNNDWLNIKIASDDSNTEWNSWLEDQQVITGAVTTPPTQGSPEEDRLSIVIASKVRLTGFNNKLQDGPSSLRYSSIPKDRFISIARGLKIHRSFFTLVEDGSPAAMKMKSKVDGHACEVFLLRTSNAIDGQSAIAITHFPSSQPGNGDPIGSRTNVMILGYSEENFNDFKMSLLESKAFPSTPVQLVMAFLEIESVKRFTEVRESVREMQETIHELAVETETGEPSSRKNLNKTVDLYFVVHHLKNDGLVSWRDQLLLFKSCVAQGGDEVLVEYLQQLVARYDHRIGRCDIVLQGASLAYQMETTHLSRKDTEIAVGDGKTMKAIAVLTMIFLPGTFIATMLAVPQIEEALKAEHDSSFGDQKWKWYIVLTLPLTGVALLAYGVWEYCYKRRYLENLFGDREKSKES